MPLLNDSKEIINRFMFSTIEKKKCKCSEYCDSWPTMGYAGYNYAHAPQELKEKIGTKAKVARKNKNKRNAISRQLHIAQNAVSGMELQRWFQNRREEMTGYCANCGNPSCKDSDEFYRFSIAHILAKAYFPSIKTNVNNWVELCFWGDKSCHSQLDNARIDLINMSCWDTIVTRFVAMYPFIAEKEKKRIPNVLLQYIETEK